MPAQVNVAVVGGGIYGCTIAVDLARAGMNVEIFEAKDDVLDGSTSHCQGRLHSGYHYPRSDTTATHCRDSSTEFSTRYPEAVVSSGKHFYAIAPGSKTAPKDYLLFMDRLKLPYSVIETRDSHVHTADLLVQVPEAFVNVSVLRRSIRRQLSQSHVKVHTNITVSSDQIPGVDFTVWATYGAPWQVPLHFEICEVALLELGRYNDESYVIMDGDFTSLDPHGRLFALYDVAHSVHHSTVGYSPTIPNEYASLLKRSGTPTSPLSHVDQMIDSASRWLWGLGRQSQHTSIYHGSMWSLRAVLPNVDQTDERPVLIDQTGSIIRVLSGKIGESVRTADTVRKLLVEQVS